MENNKWLWIGFGALVLVFILARSRAGAQVIQGSPAPDLSDETRSRFDFAARGLDSLTGLLVARGEQERDLALGGLAYQRDVELGAMSLRRDVTLGGFSLERDSRVAAAQERASVAASEAYLAGALALASSQRHAEQSATKRSFWSDLFDFGSDVIGTIFGGGNSGGYSPPPFNPNGGGRLPLSGMYPTPLAMETERQIANGNAQRVR